MFSVQRPQHDGFDRPHPLVGRVAVVAMIFAMLAIVWAEVTFLGTGDIERTLSEESVTLHPAHASHIEAVALNRWATGFSP